MAIAVSTLVRSNSGAGGAEAGASVGWGQAGVVPSGQPEYQAVFNVASPWGPGESKSVHALFKNGGSVPYSPLISPPGFQIS